mgnify:CR=1 FL=1
MNEEFETKLNQQVLINYGTRLAISKIGLKNDNFEITVDYRRILHIPDSSTNTIYVRTLQFPSIYNGEFKKSEQFKLPLDELNRTIKNKYIELRANMIKGIIYNKNVIVPLIKKVPLFSAFLNKFTDIISSLIYDDAIMIDGVNQRLENDPDYKKYFEVIIHEGYAQYDKDNNLKASEKLKLLHKDLSKKGSKTKDVIDEVLFNIIKENYDYIVHSLKLKILRTYVNLLSCLNYVTVQNNIKKISTSLVCCFFDYSFC